MSSQLRAFDRAVRSAIARETRGNLVGGGSVADALEKVVQKAIKGVRPSDVSEILREVRNKMLRSLFDVLNIEDPSTVA